MEKTALYAGSFDPITNGHLDLIERASKLYDKLVVGVIVNRSKTATFTLEERKDMIIKATEHLDNIYIDSFDGLLADYVNRNNIDVLVRDHHILLFCFYNLFSIVNPMVVSQTCQQTQKDYLHFLLALLKNLLNIHPQLQS